VRPDLTQLRRRAINRLDRALAFFGLVRRSRYSALESRWADDARRQFGMNEDWLIDLGKINDALLLACDRLAPESHIERDFLAQDFRREAGVDGVLR